MATVPAARRDAFGSDLRATQEMFRQRVIPKTQADRRTTWTVWTNFCAEHGQDPWLTNVEDQLSYFLVFGLRYRRGQISKSGRAVRSSRVEEALRAVGERFSELGLSDPRITGDRKLVPRLKGLYDYFTKEDPESTRVWPANVTILMARRASSTLPDRMARPLF